MNTIDVIEPSSGSKASAALVVLATFTMSDCVARADLGQATATTGVRIVSQLQAEEIIPSRLLGRRNPNSSELEKEFNERSARWEKETAIHSAPGATYLHRDYIAIISKGMDNPSVIVPLILKRIPFSGSDWFFALEKIAGENPAEFSEDFESGLKAWRDWAEQRGLVK